MTRDRFRHEHLRPYAGRLTAAWIMYWLALTGLLHSPKLPRPPLPLDARALIAHFVAFGLLAAGCLIAGRARRGALTNRWLGLWFALFAAYAALSEMLQPLTNRDCDPWDWVADVAGVLVVMVIFKVRSKSTVPT